MWSPGAIFAQEGVGADEEFSGCGDERDLFGLAVGDEPLVEGSEPGIAALASWAGEHGAGLVVMEASGGAEQAAFLALWQTGLPCALVNPRAGRRFAESMGRLEKTGRIDAEIIARHAAARRISPSLPPCEEQQRLSALAARLRQVTGDLSVQKQRVHSTRDPEALASLHEAIAFFTAQAKALAEQIAGLIEHDPLWAALDRTFRSLKGVAGRRVAVLLAELPEIGTLSNKAVAKLAGLAPIANDSGKRSGPRSIRGGSSPVRTILYLVADLARKYDPSLDQFRQRLLDAGKPKMVVRIALAQKLLVRLNAKARETRQAIPTCPLTMQIVAPHLWHSPKMERTLITPPPTSARPARQIRRARAGYRAGR